MSAHKSLQDQIIQKAWEDAKFKKKLLENPKAAVKDAFGTEIPDSFEVEVLEETSSKKYFILPQSPVERSKETITQEGNADYPTWD
ncbi:NHLP leader peptide family RiPP precursor [Paenibacillus harenae]|uniref:NHLP leader peptide family RiPP precursor n=1 Tax=Paenibacillus harenae TaxID=306543 RepID=UPI0027D77BF8|nr:NHLP leader peptide family RiPP precursor [Paenibacillus harenae]